MSCNNKGWWEATVGEGGSYSHWGEGGGHLKLGVNGVSEGPLERRTCARERSQCECVVLHSDVIVRYNPVARN